MQELKTFKAEARKRPAEEQAAAYQSSDFRKLVASAAGREAAGDKAARVETSCGSHCFSHCISHCVGHQAK
jgi:hypothetical protein